MTVGIVKWFDVKKGFGFIEGEDGRDVFVHYSVIHVEGFRSLVDGQRVEYEMVRGPKGLLATCVKPLAESKGKSVPLSPWGDDEEKNDAIGNR